MLQTNKGGKCKENSYCQFLQRKAPEKKTTCELIVFVQTWPREQGNMAEIKARKELLQGCATDLATMMDYKDMSYQDCRKILVK